MEEAEFPKVDITDGGVEEVDVYDNEFNVEEVDVDGGPIVTHGPTVVDVEPTGVTGPSGAAKQIGVDEPSGVDGSTRLESYCGSLSIGY
ncbi:hypothetical protein V6N13_020411 [Hibiscus sabdariffa]